MPIPRCPGQDMRFWKPEDIFNVRCPFCSQEIEFWKDDPFLNCPNCSSEVRNPRIDLGCAKWCKSAAECLGKLPDESSAVASIVDRLKLLISRRFDGMSDCIKRANEVHAFAEQLLIAEKGEHCIVKPAALLAGAILERADHSYLISGILEETGIENSNIEKISIIVDNIQANKFHDSDDFHIVFDAVQLKRLTLMIDSKKSMQDCNEIINLLKTKRSKDLAEKLLFNR